MYYLPGLMVTGCAGELNKHETGGIEDAVLSADGRTVTVTVLGVWANSAGKPCGADYSVSSAITGNVLNLKAWVANERGFDKCNLDVLICCEHRFNIAIGAPFAVKKVTHVTGADGRTFTVTKLITRPAGLVELAGIPAEWPLRSEGAGFSPNGGAWSRVYSPMAQPPLSDVAGRLDLEQFFDGGAGFGEPEYLQPPVALNGRPAQLYRWPEEGEIRVNWTVGPDTLTLLANENDFAIAELMAMAESAVPAAP